MTLRDKLIRDADAFADANGISKARLATIVVNNGKFFKSLADGGDCTTGVFERFQTVFNDADVWEAAKAADRERRASSPSTPNTMRHEVGRHHD